MNAVVADFGISVKKDDDQEDNEFKLSGIGTPGYIAGEMYGRFPDATEYADVYSYGIVTYEILAEEEPFARGISQIECCRIARSENRPEIPEYIPVSMAQLIRSCWKQKKEDRPSLTDVLNQEPNPFSEARKELLTLGNKESATFWDSFGNGTDVVEEVEYEPFMRKLLKVAGRHNYEDIILSHDKYSLCIKEICNITDMNPCITQRTYQKLNRFFGAPGRDQFLNIEAVLNNEWFHGDMSKDEAEWKFNQIADKKDREYKYLVRYSEGKPGVYSITYVTKLKMGVQHLRFTQKESRSKSLRQFMKEFVKSNRLKQAIPGRSEQIWSTAVDASQGYIQSI
eukprot:TRINITY_DN4950_c0_g1_i1.p1 TRINITY_DN4950_c0_g1~~TRINITY_DN4950_c0_g1_i1.p1  ORF type:complete len:340 (+),score=76.04 TRINITY_DN4950_c0_g1_i1:951-1970(+)